MKTIIQTELMKVLVSDPGYVIVCNYACHSHREGCGSITAIAGTQTFYLDYYEDKDREHYFRDIDLEVALKALQKDDDSLLPDGYFWNHF